MAPKAKVNEEIIMTCTTAKVPRSCSMAPIIFTNGPSVWCVCSTLKRRREQVQHSTPIIVVGVDFHQRKPLAKKQRDGHVPPPQQHLHHEEEAEGETGEVQPVPPVGDVIRKAHAYSVADVAFLSTSLGSIQ